MTEIWKISKSMFLAMSIIKNTFISYTAIYAKTVVITTSQKFREEHFL